MKYGYAPILLAVLLGAGCDERPPTSTVEVVSLTVTVTVSADPADPKRTVVVHGFPWDVGKISRQYSVREAGGGRWFLFQDDYQLGTLELVGVIDHLPVAHEVFKASTRDLMREFSDEPVVLSFEAP